MLGIVGVSRIVDLSVTAVVCSWVQHCEILLDMVGPGRVSQAEATSVSYKHSAEPNNIHCWVLLGSAGFTLITVLHVVGYSRVADQ